MGLRECIKNAIRQLLGSKLRTFLTMLGMFIGIGSVILVLSVGEGVKGSVMGLFDDLGKGAVTINATGVQKEVLMTEEDMEVIRGLEEVYYARLLGENYYTTINNYKEEESMLVVVGVPYDVDEVQSVKLTHGRMISENEERAKAKVLVISETYAKLIYGIDDPVYALDQQVEITLNNVTETYTIIGLMEAETFPGMPEEMMPLIGYIPFSTQDQIVGDGDLRSREAVIAVKDEYDPSAVGYQITRLLDKRHATDGGYSSMSVLGMMDDINMVLGLITGFIGLVAGISLVVGGVGIMNIMLVTVKERTREIGIRKAVGAKNKEILRQFLIEALILTLIGGMIGMFLGYFGGIAIGMVANIDVQLTVSMITFAVGTSSVIGITFGVYPAYQASKLDPVESLRYE